MDLERIAFVLKLPLNEARDICQHICAKSPYPSEQTLMDISVQVGAGKTLQQIDNDMDTMIIQRLVGL
jgi:hypothetical protein